MTYSLSAPTVSGFKAEARALRESALASGRSLTHAAALEEVARSHGYRDWNTARAAVPDRTFIPVQVGQRVEGRYLGQPFRGKVLAVAMLADERHFRVTIRFDDPVDVVRFESFSAFRSRVTGVIDQHGVSAEVTGDGEPHLRLTAIR